MPKAIVIYAGFGEGHKKAAEALGQALGIPIYDLLDFCPPFISKIYSGLYIFFTHYLPHIWQAVFSMAKTDFVSRPINLLHRILFVSLFNYLHKEKPAIVITTHFFPAELAAYMKQEMRFKLISVITDIRVHPIWVNSGIDCYLASLPITKDDLISLGVAKEKIISGFMPLRKGFSEEFAYQKFQKQFNLASRPSLLFVSSLRGIFPGLKQSLRSLLKEFNIFVIYGRNKKLRRYLERVKSERLHFFPFYEKIWDLVFLSTVIITKPGGMTIFESIYCKKPLIFTHYIPGQEKQNMEVLIKSGVAKFVRSDKDLRSALNWFCQNYAQIRDNYPFELKDVRPVLGDLIQRCIFPG